METINLLPKKYQKIEQRDFQFRLLILINSLLIASLLIGATLFYFLSLALETGVKPQKNTEDSLNKKFLSLNSEFLVLKKQADFIKTISPDNYPSSLRLIGSLKPEGVKILSLEAEKNLLKIRGRGLERADVLWFEKQLKANFSSVDSPVSNLTKSKDADFVFTVQIERQQKKTNE